MRKIVIEMTNGESTGSATGFWEVPDNLSDTELDQFAIKNAMEHALSHPSTQNTDNVTGTWKDYTEEGSAEFPHIFWNKYTVNT